MDPQERLFLQCVHDPRGGRRTTRGWSRKPTGNVLDGRVGVFVGVMYDEYQLHGVQSQLARRAAGRGRQVASIAISRLVRLRLRGAA